MTEDHSPSVIKMIGALEVLAAIGLTLPAALDIPPVLVRRGFGPNRPYSFDHTPLPSCRNRPISNPRRCIAVISRTPR